MADSDKRLKIIARFRKEMNVCFEELRGVSRTLELYICVFHYTKVTTRNVYIMGTEMCEYKRVSII